MEGTKTEQGNDENLWSKHHTKPTRQDSDHTLPQNMGTDGLQNAFGEKSKSQSDANSDRQNSTSIKHTAVIEPEVFEAENRPKDRQQTRKCQKNVAPTPHQANSTRFRPLKPPKGPKSNKEMSKTCGPNTTPSQQDKIQATKSLAQVHLKWPETVKNVNFFFRLRRFQSEILVPGTAFQRKNPILRTICICKPGGRFLMVV